LRPFLTVLTIFFMSKRLADSIDALSYEPSGRGNGGYGGRCGEFQTPRVQIAIQKRVGRFFGARH
jgi:hypothetical protein